MKTGKDYFAIFRTAMRAVTISFKAAPLLTGVFLGSQIVTGLIPVFLIMLSKNIIDEIVRISQGVGSIQSLLIFLVGSFALETVANFLLSIRFYTQTRLWDELAKFAQVETMKQSLRLDMEHFENSEFYNKYEQVRKRIDSVLPGCMFDIGGLLVLITTFCSVSILLVSINWLLLPLIVLVNLPILLLGMGYSMTTYNLSNSQIPEGRKADYLAMLATDKVSVKEVKLFELGHYFLTKYKKFYERVVQEDSKAAKGQFTGAFFATLLSDATYYGFYIWVALRTVAGRLTIGDVALYIQAFARTSGTLKEMLRYISSMSRNALFISDFTTFLTLQPNVVNRDNALSLDKIKSINFENVFFRYKPELPFILKNVSFEIKEDENIALVGQNGAGKTTIIKLLMRLYDVTEGTISINGVDIKNYKIEDLWKQTGTVFQDFQEYQLTAAENIGFGQIEKIGDREKIIRAAKKSGAHEFIEKLKDGYDTILGTRFEGGVDLSVGQWQKVAIARAFMRDCSVLILDEPTASIDAKSEYEIFKRFVKLVEGKITILISHRFSTVRLANRILVIENGRLLENGSHKELMEKKGKYREMFTLQAEGYK
jgi:ATP-binding cassette, subfamily B, bacterial